jgi:hypothetical protein
MNPHERVHQEELAITELEAWTSLVLLLRFVIFASDRWGALTGPSSGYVGRTGGAP